MRMKLAAYVNNRNGFCQIEVKAYDESGKRVTVASKMTDIPIGKKSTPKVNKLKDSLLEEWRNKKTIEEPVVVIQPDSMTFSDFMSKWLDNQKNKVAKTTLAGYRNCVKIINDYFSKKNLLLSELKPYHIDEFYSEQIRIGKSANTVHHYHANIHKALDYAVRNEFIDKNPSDYVELPKIKDYEAGFYTAEEVKLLFKSLKDDPIELCVYIAVAYGMRKSEILGLKWDAIDFENDIIHVKYKTTSALDENGHYEIINADQLKTEKSRRSFPLSPKAKEELLKEKKKQEYYRKLCGTSYDSSGDGFVCRQATGERITPAYFSDHFRYLFKNNGLRKIRLHDLRHTCAHLLLNNGINLKELQEWLGHSSITTTGNIYAHLEHSSKKEAVKTISNLIN